MKNRDNATSNQASGSEPARKRHTRRDAMGMIGASGIGIVSVLGGSDASAQGTPYQRGAGVPPPPPDSYPPLTPMRNDGRFISIDGNRVYVEERGQGIPVVLSTGGQNRLETVRPLAEKVAASGKYRAITWDRADVGRADIVIKGARDLDLWTDQLAALLPMLNARPAYFAGTSAGSRIAYVMALRYPEYVRGLLTYNTTGGGTIGESLGRTYYGNYGILAEKEGMEAVSKTPFWAERIEQNPDNKQRLLSMDPHEFARVMFRWQKAMRSNPDPVIGVNADDLRQLKANGTPVAIVIGCEGQVAHRRDRSELYAQLTGAELLPDPPGYCEEFEEDFGKTKYRPETPELRPYLAYEGMSSIPKLIDDFITATEAKLKSGGG